MRKMVKEYANEMEEAMSRKDEMYTGKLNYKNIEIKRLVLIASDKFQDLVGAVYTGNTKRIIKKSISVSNYCMMIREKMKGQNEKIIKKNEVCTKR